MERFGRGLVAQRLLGPLVIVKPGIGSQLPAGLTRSLSEDSFLETKHVTQ